MEFYEQFDLLLDISPVYCESLSSTTASSSHLLLRVPLTYYCEFLSPPTSPSCLPQVPLIYYNTLSSTTTPSHPPQHPLIYHNTLSPTTTPSHPPQHPHLLPQTSSLAHPSIPISTPHYTITLPPHLLTNTQIKCLSL